MKTKSIAGVGLLTAITIVLQMIGAVIRFGPFSITLVLIPIVVGAALYGPLAGAWFGFVFGMVVLLSGDAAAAFGDASARETTVNATVEGTYVLQLAVSDGERTTYSAPLTVEVTAAGMVIVIR